jgi:hypothetical protein
MAAAALTVSIFGIRLVGGMIRLSGAAFDAGLAVAGQIAALPIAGEVIHAGLGTPAVLLPLAVMGFFAFLGAGALTWLKMFRVLARCQGYSRWA